MSHNYSLRCSCGAESESSNHAKETLLTMLRLGDHLVAIYDALEIYTLDISDAPDDAGQFIANHWGCGPISVVCEAGCCKPEATLIVEEGIGKYMILSGLALAEHREEVKLLLANLMKNTHVMAWCNNCQADQPLKYGRCSECLK